MAHNLKHSDDDCSKYLLFRLGNEMFGTPLLGVREVVEFHEIKPIPHTIPSFLGVINIRGEIVGVIDLRIRFGFSNDLGNRQGLAMMVFHTTGGPLAAVADHMDSVVRLLPEQIDSNARIESHFPLNYLLGIATVKSHLVTLIDLKHILENEELKSILLEGA